MPGRKYSATSGYRYGFNGKENDNEVKGEGNQQDYGMRIYDPRLGRFLTIDPISSQYPELTPYQFASNRPIDGIDLDGLEFYSSNKILVELSVSYDPKIKQITHGNVYISAANPNMPIHIGKQIITYKQQQLRDCPYNECVVSANTVTIAEINSVSNLQANNGGITDAESEGLVNESESLSGNKGTVTTSDGKNSKVRSQKQAAAWASEASVGNSTGVNSGRLARAGAYLELATIAGHIIQNYFLNRKFSEIHSQALKTPLALKLMQEAINGETLGVTIPDKYLNSTDLSKLGEYLMSGEPIYNYEMKSGKEVKTANLELTEIGRKIWRAHIKKENEIKKELTLEKIRRDIERNQKTAVDQTGKKNF